FNEKYIDDTIYAGIQDVEAAVFVHNDKPFFAFEFVTDSTSGEKGYYDLEARPLESFFLMAPVDFTRISSRFSPRRFHPVQKRWKAHKGTDYAAPTGTPIWSTADGVVIASRYTKYNGNYVKIRHNSTYTTQYLHMSKRNVRKGDYVEQGDIIGFVGSTGLATGPHVCYRFWVHGVQRDPYKQILPAAEPINDSLKDSYFAAIAPLKKELAKIEYSHI
ncbi:MAG TPA: peptidoglycan DD-metalloendopeptidase family protein, partial [Salinimicrobium sp.]|nr:peptidoglycan DD-metalloendopeptidase family protein [Salinimicrobium sp.]